jgi:adenosylcobinamide-GDP ribazoletransferase
LRTLTRLPVPGKEGKTQSGTLFWFPAVGALLGAGSVAVSRLPLPPLVSASLVVSLQAYLTRGFHLDGLCDVADGFGGGWDRERTLEIMKDSHVGAFGVIALVCTLFVQCASVSSLLPFWPILLFAPMVGRFMQTMACATCSYARKEGGTAGTLVSESGKRHAIAPALQILLFVTALGLLDSPSFYPAVGALALSSLLFLFLRRASVSRLGGVTGDVLGEIEVLCETAAYLGALVPLATMVSVG